MSAIAPPSFYYGSQTGSFFVGGSFAFSGVSAASSERRAARGCGCGALSRALRCPALAAALDARCAAPFRARFPEAAALLSAVPATLHASLGRNFFTVHLGLFVVATLVAAAIVAPLADVPYLDGWLLCTGAITGGSLSAFSVERLTPGAQGVVWILMACGGVTITALGPLCYRLYMFRARLKPALRRARRLGRELRRAARPRLPSVVVEEEDGAKDEHGPTRPLRLPASSPSCIAAADNEAGTAAPAPALGSPTSAAAVLAALDAADADALLAELGAQDEALAAVALVAASYTLFWTLVIMGALWQRAAAAAPGGALAEALAARGVSRGWFSLFFATSAFNNVGLSLFASSAAPLAGDSPALLALVAASLAGNTAWPLALRFILRCGAQAAETAAAWLSRGGGFARVSRSSISASPTPRGARLAAFARGARYALKNSQRVYHLLFPPRETAALAAALLLTNAVQLAAFGSSGSAPAVVAVAPRGADRAAVALFTIIQSRSTGFTVVDLNALAPVVVVLFAFMMWFSPYPLVALWAREDNEDGPPGADLQLLFSETAPTAAPGGRGGRFSRWPALVAFSRRYLQRHATWLILAFVILAAAEAPILAMPSPDGSGRAATNIFALLFEILSAYGTNGASLGWPGAPFNLCGMFHPISKLILIALMFLGRHRSMPRRVDAALQSRVAAAEELAAAAEAELKARRGSTGGGGSGGASSLTLAARVGSFTQENFMAALTLIRNASEETLASMAAGTRQQRADAVDAALQRQRARTPRQVGLLDAARRFFGGAEEAEAAAVPAAAPQQRAPRVSAAVLAPPQTQLQMQPRPADGTVHEADQAEAADDERAAASAAEVPETALVARLSVTMEESSLVIVEEAEEEEEQEEEEEAGGTSGLDAPAGGTAAGDDADASV